MSLHHGATISNLPSELIENIFEHIHGSYPSPNPPTDLHQCALVCRTWAALAQPIVFSQLLVHRYDERINILQENPHLRQHIKQAWVRTAQHMFLEDRQDTFAELPDVRELYLLGRRSDLILMEPEDSVGLFENLTTLALSGLSCFPVEYLRYCTSLRHLKTRNCVFGWEVDHGDEDDDDEEEREDDADNTNNDEDDGDTSTPSKDSPRRQLHSLHVLETSRHADSQMKILDWIVSPESPFDITALKTFWAVDNSNKIEPYEWIREVIRLCGSTLEDLMLDPPTIFGARNAKIKPETLPHPSTLLNLRTISTTILQELEDYTNFIPWLNAFFSQLPSNNRLEEIRIACIFMDLPNDDDNSDEPLKDYLNRYGWEDLDNALTSSHLNVLKRVVIGVHELSEEDCVDKLGTLLRNFLPSLDKKGILEVANASSDEAFEHFSLGDHWWRVEM